MTLRSIQSRFLHYIGDGDPTSLVAAFNGTSAEVGDRLAIFRNNSIVTLTTALSVAFPVVCLLVDARFFAFMAHAFIAARPPQHPCLSEYGECFPEFIASFSPASPLPYLSDLARLEWAISRVPATVMQRAIPISKIAELSGDPAAVYLTIDPDVSFVESQYPIDYLWEIHQSEEINEQLPLEARSAFLQIHRGRSPPFRRLSRTDWIFRSSVTHGASLGVALEITLEKDRDFSLAEALRALFSEGLVLKCY